MKAELKKFVSQIEPEYSIPEIGFTAEGIAQHIQDYFSEQRRYQKKNNGKKVRSASLVFISKVYLCKM